MKNDNEMDDFMLNTNRKPEILTFTEDTIVDTIPEKDMEDGIETGEVIEEAVEEIEEEPKTRAEYRKEKKEKKKPTKKVFKVRAIFCAISVAFIIGCFIFYGVRTIRYYRIFNPRTSTGESVTLLGPSIISNTPIVIDGSGLYRKAGASVFKGDVENNYVKFSNQIWRVVKVNSDNSVDIVLDTFINAMRWDANNSNYEDSDIRKYLNEVYLKTLNTEGLTNISFCVDDVIDLAEMTCEERNTEDQIRLLSVTEFLNSRVENDTFLAGESDMLWLHNHNEDNAWYINGINISETDKDLELMIKPIITLRRQTILFSGTGTIDNPYIVEENNNELNVGNFIELDEDLWVVYEVEENSIRLSLSGVLPLAYRFDTDINEFDPTRRNSIARYLNTTFFEGLSYKDRLLETTWFIGPYNDSFEDIFTKEVSAKVGMLNVADLKINNTSDAFYLLTPGAQGQAFMFDQGLRQSRVDLIRDIKPTIRINKTDIKSGDGTRENPFVLEV